MRLAALPLLIWATACYRYEPVQTVQPGADVRARLETEAAVRRSAGLDDPVVVISGRVLESTPESLRLDVLVVRDPSVFSGMEVRDTVDIQLAELRELAERRISTPRTLMFVGALGAGSYLLVRGISAIVGGNEGDDNGGGPQFDRRRGGHVDFPIFRIPAF